jgi:O-acetyl-ADP-ribose deacetylase (regulator of RNase III)
LTDGFDLPAKYVIHTVGPVWRGGDQGEDELLAACYRHSLSLALRHRIRTVAFPAVSTGVYGFPKDRAARIAADETERFLRTYPEIDKVLFCCLDRETFQIYRDAVRVLDER